MELIQERARRREKICIADDVYTTGETIEAVNELINKFIGIHDARAVTIAREATLGVNYPPEPIPGLISAVIIPEMLLDELRKYIDVNRLPSAKDNKRISKAIVYKNNSAPR